MKKIGVLFGVENTFPGALVDRINSMELEDIRAEFVHVGGVQMATPSGYDVIVDRISHEMPFYRAWLKNAVLGGAQVINNPFWWSADDKFFNYALASKLGVAVPRTILLPHKEFPPQINARSVRNLEYPLDWDGIFDYVGFPAFLKPHDGGGWRDVFHVHNRDEFFAAYDQTRDLCMTLQAAVNFQQYFRCFVVGQSEVRIMAYDPRQPHEHRYIFEPPTDDPKLLQRIERDAIMLCRALGYDLNTVEFAVEDGIPYAIDFMNPVPDADLYSVGEANFNWIIDAMARLAVKKAQSPSHVEIAPQSQAHWSVFLSGVPAQTPKPKTPRRTPVKKSSAKTRK
ncbi:ATP-grasp domain-containing protein [Edaphobacter dinghuensis]|uniref:Glutathione synthase n=1 Tax=Edaphobacter dinghuensis TaxID=1560005 RepID=A0A917HJS3_9BACT|nr:hypothetical protein [Edaphobacter dinghuensis]GGG80925.1 glutathione synthase [Edaphobacter dinghuensis]